MAPLKIGPFYLGRPTDQEVQEVVKSCQKLPFNFPHVTVTKRDPPIKPDILREGWSVDHSRLQVGRGRAAYRRAQALLRGWRHFQLGWATVNSPPVREGQGVVVTARSLLLWTCNPLRISWVEEGGRRVRTAAGEEKKGHRLAFGHTTLRGHQISGEERFAVEWHPHDDSVWYDIYTVSRPATPIATLAHPLLRFYQAKFAKDSMATMLAQMKATPGQQDQRSKPAVKG